MEKIKSVLFYAKKYWYIVLLVALFIGYRIYSNQKNLPKYEVFTVSKGDLVETLATTGTVRAQEYANLGFQTGGKVSWVGVKKGDVVKKGQAIAKLDTTVLNAAYQQSLNNYRNYEAAAQSALDSVKDHSGDETYAQKATRTAAEVARDNAYDAMIAAQANLKFATIFAPFEGVVAEVSPSFAGANVGIGGASYIIVNPDTTYFESEIAETDLPKVKSGLKVKIRLDAYPDTEIDGVIETIGVVAFTSSAGGNAYSLRISLPKNVDQKYKVGMEGDVDIVLGTVPQVLKVPTSAIVNEDEENFVWLFVNGKIKKTKVELGSESDFETEIKAGLNEFDKVVTLPSNKFTDGQKIKI